MTSFVSSLVVSVSS